MSTVDCRLSSLAVLPEYMMATARRQRPALDPRTPHFGSKTEDVDACSSWGTESTADSTDAASTGSPVSGDELWPTPAAMTSSEELWSRRVAASFEESPLFKASRESPVNHSEVSPGLPSAGSVLHGIGECEPCAWFWKPQGCLHGQSCFRCHLCPSGEIKARKAAKLAQRRSTLRREENQPDSNEDLLLGLGSSRVPANEEPLRSLRQPNQVQVAELCEFDEAAEIHEPQQPSPTSAAVAGAEALGLLAKAPASGMGVATGLLSQHLPLLPQQPLSGSMLEESSLTLLRCLGPPPGLEALASPLGTSSALSSGTADVEQMQPVGSSELELSGRQPVSAGSAQHHLGLCEPCAWFWKPQGCQNGLSCSRCHLCPKGEVKARKNMKKASMRMVPTNC